jgi:hypothetical protein
MRETGLPLSSIWGAGKRSILYIVAVRGEGDAISALLQFSVPNRWLPIDVSDGEYH